MFTKGTNLKVLREGDALRVVFFYPGEEGTYVENVHVRLYENGIVHMTTRHEEVTTMLRNCEIVWSCTAEDHDHNQKIRVLHPTN